MIRMVPGEAALLLKTGERILVIPDLHLGFERELAEKGIVIPSQTERIFTRLHKLLQRQKPDRLVFLGDIKHGTSIIQLQELKEIPRFFERLLKFVNKINIIPGNHDGGIERLLPENVELASSKGIVLRDGRKKISLVHGHAWSDPESFSCDEMIMGHHHFTIMLRDSSGLRSFEPVWLMARWDRAKMAAAYLKSRGIRTGGDPPGTFRKNFKTSVKDTRIIVMPTFNDMLGGTALNRRKRDARYLGPVFSSGAIEMDRSELYLLDGTYLGRLSQMTRVT